MRLQNKLWIKPAGEMSFVYGHHVLKSHVGRMTEDAEQYDHPRLPSFSLLLTGIARIGMRVLLFSI